MSRIFFLFLWCTTNVITNVHGCIRPKKPYIFDKQAFDEHVESAQSVKSLLRLVIEQLGVARFVAERMKFDDVDSYMSARYAGNMFSYNRMLECLYREEYVLRGDLAGYLKLLRTMNIFDDELLDLAKDKVLAEPHQYARCSIAPSFRINERDKWLYHLTKHRQAALSKLDSDSKKERFAQAAQLVASVYLLTQFGSDVGSLYAGAVEKLDESSEIKACLRQNNQALYHALTTLYKVKKRPKVKNSRYSWGFSPFKDAADFSSFKDAEKESELLVPPGPFQDSHYTKLYGLFIPASNRTYPRDYMAVRYGLYEGMRCAQKPARRHSSSDKMELLDT